MKFKKAEQETVIRLDKETDKAEIYTCCKIQAKKLEKLATEFPDTYRIKSKDKWSVTAETTKKYISFRRPKKLTAEQIEKLRNNLVRNKGEIHNV